MIEYKDGNIVPESRNLIEKLTEGDDDPLVPKDKEYLKKA